MRLSALLMTSCMALPLSAQEEKPNVLFFYIDDLGWKDLSCYGSRFYETPSIDALASDGIRFTSAYQSAARCVPSRTSLFTGKYHERKEIADGQGVVPGEYTFAEAFQDAGYHTFFTGKWHLGKDPSRYPEAQGFDVNKGGCAWGAPNGSSEGGGRYFSPYDCPTLEDGPEGEYLTDRLTQETIDFIEAHQANQSGQPFMACVFHYAVHTPIEAPGSLVQPYQDKLQSMHYERPLKEIDGPAKTNLRQDHPVYAGMIASVDESVRRIRETLESLEIDDNTIIIFSTDHGGLSTTLKSNGREIATSNYPLRTGKGWVYEGGIRSPLIIYWPGVTTGGMVTDEPVVNMDFYPTMLEMAGIPLKPEQHKDGESFADLLWGKSWSRKAPIMWYFPKAKTGTGNPNMAAVRVDQYKLIHFMHQDRFELYDLEKDLPESHNLMEERPVLGEQMKTILFDLEAETDMPGLSNSRMAIEDEILPEYEVSIDERQFPEATYQEMELLAWANIIKFKWMIEEENDYVHPVDLRYYYRLEGQTDWNEIHDMVGRQYRLLPGMVEHEWNYSAYQGETMDFRITATLHNALYPVSLGEELIKGVTFQEKGGDPVVPEGRRLREIVADRYGAQRLMIGGTTGSWAFGEPNGTVMDREFSYVTPENDFKQSTVRRDISTWDWSHADAWLQHIIEHDQILRIHGPISPQSSKWVKDDSRTAAELEEELITFFTALCQRYNGVQNVAYMDVVNETVTPEGAWMGPKPGVDSWENPWPRMGFITDIPEGYPALDSVPLYIVRAFEIANQHAPDLKLLLNQHGGMEEPMWMKIKELVRYLRQEHGFRIDALGWQAHVETGWEKKDQHLERLRDLADWCQANDLEFHITEFDAWILDHNRHDFHDQAATYEAVMKVMIEKSRTGKIGWNTWHISDAKGFQIERTPALFDAHYRAKPAYYAVQKVLETGNSKEKHAVEVAIYGEKGDATVSPLPGAQVVLNGITGFTDKQGMGSLRVPGGEQQYIVKKKAISQKEEA